MGGGGRGDLVLVGGERFLLKIFSSDFSLPPSRNRLICSYDLALIFFLTMWSTNGGETCVARVQRVHQRVEKAAGQGGGGAEEAEGKAGQEEGDQV